VLTWRQKILDKEVFADFLTECCLPSAAFGKAFCRVQRGQALNKEVVFSVEGHGKE